jgi:TonB family protein
MSTKTSEKTEKILRIGVIHAGKIVEERLLRKRENVAVGSDPKNTFVLPGAEVPKSVRLFELKGTAYVLCFAEAMDGRLNVNDSALDFAALKSQNLATKTGDTYRIALTDSSKGKVQVGDVTLLFQFVTPPPVAAPASLPAVARGGILKSMDPLFSGLVTASLILHFGSAAFLSTLDPPPPPSIDELDERVLRHIVPDLSKLKPPPKPETKTDAPAEKKAEKKASGDEKKKAGETKKPPADNNARKAALQKAVQNKGLLKILGARGAGGALADVFAASSGKGVAEALAAAGGGVGFAKEGDGLTSGPRSSGGGTGAAGIGDMNAPTGGGEGGAAGSLGGRQTVQVRGEVRAENVTDVDGSLDPKLIVKTIRARMAGFKACYENALKRSPNLQGKVTVTFTIDEEGRVTEASVEQDSLGDPDVGRCIVGIFKRLRFPKPDEGSVQASFPFVFVPSG